MNDLPDMSPVGDVVFLGVDLGWYLKTERPGFNSNQP